VIRHRAPDVVTHLYQPRGINEPVLLYRGPFNTQGDERSERPYDGDVRLAWLPTPRIEARGERDTAPGDIEALLESGADTNIWYQRLQVHLPGTPGVLPLPSEEAPPWSHRPGSAYLGPTDVYPPDIGDGAALTRVTGLVPNGWDSFDGSRIADPSDRRCTWFGRAIADGGGWVLELDTVNPDQDFRKELRQRGGYGITHAVSLSRAGGATFTAADATDALHAVRAAFSLILGRRSDVVLPVGGTMTSRSGHAGLQGASTLFVNQGAGWPPRLPPRRPPGRSAGSLIAGWTLCGETPCFMQRPTTPRRLR
jgi:hypothetical protein